MKNFLATIIIFLLTTPAFAASEKLFYLTNDMAGGSLLSNDKLQQVKSHAKSINIIAPQIYALSEAGVIWGSVDPLLLKIAKEQNIKVMPLIINSNFDQTTFHNFLHNPDAQKRAINQMIVLCKTYGFYGIQFDFENIQMTDRDAYTQFFKATATQLHQNGFALSAAVVPRLTETAISNEFDRWYFENWSGAYDYTQLAQIGDFITVMAYDMHTTLTTPGPIAALDWVEDIIKELLKTIPAEKISLGVPAYSGYWKTGKLSIPSDKPSAEKYSFRSKGSQIGYAELTSLLARINKPLIWDEQAKTSYVLFNQHGMYEYLFVENARSFKAKLDLAERYHLRGISVWKLGMEDPQIWAGT